ncbi:hypothetical protein BH23THE1_BH23THE1_16500 [soil metagenome]
MIDLKGTISRAFMYILFLLSILPFQLIVYYDYKVQIKSDRRRSALEYLINCEIKHKMM